MGTFYGADVGQLRELARQLDAAAERFDSLRVSVGGRVDNCRAWKGPVSDRFRATWRTDSSRALSSAAALVRRASSRLKQNAIQQEAASRADGVTSVRSGNRLSPKACIEEARLPEVTTKDTRFGTEMTIRDKWGDQYGGTWSTEEHIRGGAHADSHADGGYNADEQRLEGSIGVDAQAGWETDQSATYENGLFTGEVSTGGFAGVRGDLGANGDIGLDGAHGSVGGSAFIGSERTVRGSVDYGGVEGDIEAGIMAGVGIEGHADASVSLDEIKLDVELGISVGIGIKISPSISIEPKEIFETLRGFLPF